MRPFGPERSYPPRVQPAVRRGRPVFRSRTLCHIWPSGPDCLTGSSAELRIGSGMLATRPVRQRGWTCLGGHSCGSCARPVPRALHTHERFPAQPGRALVRPAHRKAAPKRGLPEHPGARGSCPSLSRNHQSKPEVFRLDQDRRRDTCQHCSFQSTHFRDRTLAGALSAFTDLTQVDRCDLGTDDPAGPRRFGHIGRFLWGVRQS